MLELLRRLFSWAAGQRRRRPVAGPRPRVRLTVDALEDRLALSLVPLPDLPGLAGGAFLPAFHGQHHRTLLIPKVSQIQFNSVDKNVLKILNQRALDRLAVPDLSNVTFAMLDQNGFPHQLGIHNEFFNQDGTAKFDGLWDQANQAGRAGGVPVFDGQLAWRAQGILITFSFGGDHFFAGYITAQNGVWHIDGQVTKMGGGGPGHLSGNRV